VLLCINILYKNINFFDSADITMDKDNCDLIDTLVSNFLNHVSKLAFLAALYNMGSKLCWIIQSKAT